MELQAYFVNDRFIPTKYENGDWVNVATMDSVLQVEANYTIFMRELDKPPFLKCYSNKKDAKRIASSKYFTSIEAYREVPSARPIWVVSFQGKIALKSTSDEIFYVRKDKVTLRLATLEHVSQHFPLFITRKEESGHYVIVSEKSTRRAENSNNVFPFKINSPSC